MAADTPTAAEIVERESRARPRAGIAAILAGILGLGASIALGVIFSDIPRVFVIEALQDVAGLNPEGEGLRREQLLFYDDKALLLLGAALVIAFSFVAMAYALTFLFDATRARNPALPPALRLAAPFGAIAFGLSQIAVQVVVAARASDFASSSDQASEAARDALRSDALIAAQFVQLLGTFALAVAFVLIALNAMRAGLLSRFMGILGIIVGVTFVLPLDQQGVVRGFFLVALGLLLLNRWPTGVPPAWAAGEAVPWPTQQELREAREQQQGHSREPAGGAPEAPRTETPSPATSARKKRKRRG